MIAVTIEDMSPALSQVVLQIWIKEIWQNMQLPTPLRLIARMNFSFNYSCELLNLTGTVGKVELISTFKPGLHISRKNRKHKVENTSFKLSRYALVFT